MRTVLITGATGYVGRALCSKMSAGGWNVRAAVRFSAQADSFPPGVTAFPVGSIDSRTKWDDALKGVDTIIHLAAAVPQKGVDDEIFQNVNVLGTGNLAHAAAASGVKRLVYLSSIEVHGTSNDDKPFTENDQPDPKTRYGTSKMEAESNLLRIAGETGMEVIILRSPLVYGPGKTGNLMGLIIKMIERNMPLPLASIDNHRSFIYLGNLLDAIVASCVRSAAPVNIFLVSDGPSLSTPDLIRLISSEMKKKPGLVSFPVSWLKAAGAVFKKKTAVHLLTDSYHVDNSKIRQEFGWTAPFTVEEGIRATIASTLKN